MVVGQIHEIDPRDHIIHIKPEQCFVLMEKHVLSCKSIIAAVDMAFKLSYILWTDYPWQAAYTWDVLQKVVYGLGEGRGKEKKTLSPKAIRAFLTQPEH